MTDVTNLLALDLSKATQRVVLMTDKTGKECGVLVLSSDSPQAAAEQDRQRVEGSKFRAERNGVLLDPDNNPDDKVEFDKRIKGAMIAGALAVTADWFGFENGTKPAPYDAGTMGQLYAKFPGWYKHVLAKSEGGINNFLMQP